MRFLRRSLLIWCLSSPLVWASPSTTLTIDPSATSGTTITAADENDRNGDVSTWANAHDHNDIDQTANSVNLGDGTAGAKSLCANAADSTDLCLRWDDTNNLWTLESNGSTNDDMIVRSTGTGGLAARQVVLGDGAGPIRALGSVGTSGQFLKSQGTGSDPTWAYAGAPTMLTTTAEAFSAGSQTDIAYTDLDLTSATSATATVAILNIGADNAAADNYTTVTVRTNGQTPSQTCQAHMPDLAAGANGLGFIWNQCIVALDAGQVIEYSLNEEGTSAGNGGIKIHVLGYWN